jgi:hypothetical protein
MNNEDRASAVEKFILREAIQAGVVKEIQIMVPRNPNKWGKTLAPWYNDECREAKWEMGRARKEYGKRHANSTNATRRYLKTC